MMYSPEAVYEMAVKGKSTKEIKRKIRSWKREIIKLRFILVDPFYRFKTHFSPREEIQIKFLKEYIQVAKTELIFRGEKDDCRRI